MCVCVCVCVCAWRLNKHCCSTALAGAVCSSPAISGSGETVFVGSYDGSVYALDAVTGALVWSYATGGIVVSSPTLAMVPVASPSPHTPASQGHGELVFIGSLDLNVYALNSANGKLAWKFTTGGQVGGSPVVCAAAAAALQVHVPSDDGLLYTLSALTGELDWKYNTTCNSMGTTPACGVNRTVYVGCLTTTSSPESNRGSVHAFGIA